MPLQNKRTGKRAKAALPQALIDSLGPPPDDTLDRRTWYALKIAALDHGIALGHPWASQNKNTRDNAMADAKLTTELLADELAKVMKERDRTAAANATGAKETERAKDNGAATRTPLLRAT